MHQIRRNSRVGGKNVFHTSHCPLRRRQDLGMNSEAVEPLNIEISNKKCKDKILNATYRPPNGYVETCENYFKSLFANASRL